MIQGSVPLSLLLLLLLLGLPCQTRPQVRRHIPDADAQEAAKGQQLNLVAQALEEVRAWRRHMLNTVVLHP